MIKAVVLTFTLKAQRQAFRIRLFWPQTVWKREQKW